MLRTDGRIMCARLECPSRKIGEVLGAMRQNDTVNLDRSSAEFNGQVRKGRVVEVGLVERRKNPLW